MPAELIHDEEQGIEKVRGETVEERWPELETLAEAVGDEDMEVLAENLDALLWDGDSYQVCERVFDGAWDGFRFGLRLGYEERKAEEV